MTSGMVGAGFAVELGSVRLGRWIGLATQEHRPRPREPVGQDDRVRDDGFDPRVIKAAYASVADDYAKKLR